MMNPKHSDAGPAINRSSFWINLVLCLLVLSIPFGFDLLLSGNKAWAANSKQIEPTGPMQVPRQGHTATLLPDGRVLIIGGIATNALLDSIEFYDPASRQFAFAGDAAAPSRLSTPRVGHTATLVTLADNTSRVIIAGGVVADGSSSELAAKTPSKRVKIAGGTISRVVKSSSIEIFDPATGMIVGADRLTAARSMHTATVLNDGRIFFAGGNADATAEIYDPNNTLGPATVALSEPRTGHSSTLFSDGSVFLAGGGNATAEFINPNNAAQSYAGIQLLAVRYGHSALIGPDRNVYLVGGDDANTVEKYNPSDGTVSPVSSLPAPQWTAVELANTRALVIGSSGASVLDLLSNTVELLPESELARTGATATDLPRDRKILVAGGENSHGELFDQGALFNAAQVRTDRDDYAPGSDAQIIGTGFRPREVVQLQVLHADDKSDDDETSPAHQPWQVTADAAGKFQTSWHVPADQDELGASLELTAWGETSGLVARARYTDSVGTPTSIGSTNATASGTTLAVTVPASGVALGNAVILTFAMDPVSGTVSVADTKGNTYTKDADVMNGTTGSGTGVRTVVFSAPVTNALVSGNTITVTHPSAASRAVSAFSVSGLVSSSLADVTTNATGSTTPASSGSTAITTQANELLIGAFGLESKNGTLTAGTGYTVLSDVQANPGGAGNLGITISTEYEIVSATGAYTADGTITAVNWAAAIVTYKAAPLVLSLNRAGANPTNASSVTFSVTFSGIVTGVDTGDFSLATSGVSGASITGFSGSGASYTVTVGAGSGTGTIGLNLVDNDSIADGSGNKLGGIGANNGDFTGAIYTIDKTAPTVTGVSSTTADGSYGIGTTIAILVTISEVVTVTGTPQLALNAGGGAVASYSSGSGSTTLTFNYTVAAGQDSSDLDYSSTTALTLNGGTIKDAAANNATLTLASPGAAGSLGANKAIVVDTTTPSAPTGLDMTTATDSGGSSTDNITTNHTPAFTGTAEAGSTVIIYSDGSPVGTNTAANFSAPGITVIALATGAHSITATATDAAGNVSAASSALSVIIGDGIAPTSLGTANSASSSGSAGTNLIITLTAAVAVSNTVIVTVAMDPTNVIVALADNKGNIYTKDIDVTNATATTTGVRTLVFSSLVTSALAISDRITNNFSAPLVAKVASAFAVSGLVTASRVDQTHTATNASASGAPNSGTTSLTTQPDELLIGALGVENASVSFSVFGSSFTNVPSALAQTTGSGASAIAVQPTYRLVNATNTYSASGTLSPNSLWAAAIVTYKIAVPTASIVLANATPTNLSSVDFTVTFSESVLGVDSGDFALATTGVSGASISSVTGSGTSYTVTVNTGTGSGTIGLNLVDDDSIVDSNANPLGGTGTTTASGGNGSVTGPVYTIDKTAPTVTINQASSQLDPTNASPINFTVVFSESVSGFTSSDVTISGTAGGTKTVTVTGGPSTYNVAVSGMTDGTVIASIGANAATDTAGNSSAASTSTDNTVTYDTTAPTVTINQAASQLDPTNASPINFTVVFSEAVSGFASGDVTITGTAGGTKTVTVTGGPSTYNVAVSGMTDGTVIASIGAGAATDTAGNSSAASTSTDNTVTYDTTAPTVTINQAASQLDPTNASPINFTVVFSESVSGLTSSDVTITGTADGTKTVTITGGPSTYNVAVSGMTDGTVIASIGAGAATDTAGNSSAASTSTDNTVTYDTTAPTVTINQAASQLDPTNASPINFTVVFSESVSGFTSSDVTITGTAGGTKTVTITGGPSTYNVAVSGMTDGTVIASIDAAAATDTAGNSSEASTSTDNTVTFETAAPTAPTVNIVPGFVNAANKTAVDIDISGEVGTSVSGSVTDVGAAHSVSLSGTIPGGGTLTLTKDLSSLDDGTVTAAATLSDAAGNTSGAGNDSATKDAVDPTTPTVNIVPTFVNAANKTAVDIDITGEPGTIVSGSVTDVGAAHTVSLSGPIPGGGTLTLTKDLSGLNEGTLTAAATLTDVAGNTSSAGSDTATKDATAPTVTINQAAGQSDPATNVTTINFTVVFSESVSGFSVSDVSITGTAGATTVVVTPAGPAATYNVAVTGMADTGTVIADVLANAATDAAGNTSAASTSTDNTVSFWKTGDLDGDNCIGSNDLAILQAYLRAQPPNDARYDVNGDGKVDIADSRWLVLHYTNGNGTCP